MPISQKIAKLTALALKDRVLTAIERKTIVDAALQEGISKGEINSYLDNAIKERLKTYRPEELQHCMYCGAQTPLLSENCLFCGKSLSKKSENIMVPPVYIMGREADIINRENKNTAAQQRNLQRCPDCGAQFPLISNICSSCGHILHEQTDSELNIKNLTNNISISISELKSSPKPTLLDVVKYRLSIISFLLAAACLVLGFSLMGFSALAGLFFIVSMALLIVALIYLRKQNNEYSPVKIADDKFYNALSLQEMYARQIATLYGDNAEAQQLQKKFSEEILVLKQNRQRNRNILAIGIAVIITSIVLIPFLSPDGKSNYRINRNLFAQIYDNSDVTKEIKPYLPYIDAKYKPFFSVSSNAVLCVELLNFDTFISSEENVHYYRLRVSNIKLESSGKPAENADITPRHLFLMDKDLNHVGSKYILNLEHEHTDDTFDEFLIKPYKSFYADYCSSDSVCDFKEFRNIIDSAYYFVLD